VFVVGINEEPEGDGKRYFFGLEKKICSILKAW
jgi:hypothetical protein